MKKLVIATILSLSLTGCSNSSNQAPNTSSPNSQQSVEDEETAGSEGEASSIEVNKGLLNVTINLPSSFFDDGSGDAIDSDAIIQMYKEQDINATMESDGSFSLVMSKAKHDELLTELRTTIYDSFQEMSDDDTFSSIVDITAENDTFDVINMFVNQEAYESSFDSFAQLGIAMQVQIFNLMNGTPDDKITINLIDSETETTFDTVVYPDVWND